MNHHTLHTVCPSFCIISWVACFAQLLAAEPQQPMKNLILPGEAFLVEDRPTFIFWPPEGKRQKPQPWVMYAPTLTPYPDSQEK